MRYQDLRRPRGLGRFWLYLRLLWLRMGARRSALTISDLSRLSDHQLTDIGAHQMPIQPVGFWRFAD